MPTHYLLVDYENVKRLNPALLASGDHHVILFLGPQEAKLPVELVLAMERLGPRGQYVRLQTRGPNALDFLLCHHLGTLTARAPRARFHVLSRDTGFDPLLAHLCALGYHCVRVATLEELPGARLPAVARGAIPAPPAPPPAVAAPADAVARAVALLHKFRHNKPASVTTLRGTLRALCLPEAPPEQVTALISALVAAGYVQLTGEAVSYALPPPPAPAPVPAPPAVAAQAPAVATDPVARAVALLHKFRHKPASVTALHKHLSTQYFPQPPADQVSALINTLVARGYVQIKGARVTYALPAAD